jgi:hypothetical protein
MVNVWAELAKVVREKNKIVKTLKRKNCVIM